MAKTLAELKAENAEKESKEAEVVEEVPEVQEVIEQKEEQPEQQEKPEGEETERELEPWEVINEDKETSDNVPLKTLLKTKKKFKLRLSDKDTEIEKLRTENEQLKSQPVNVKLKRPVEYDFDTDEEYHKALDEYDNQRFNDIENRRIERENIARIKDQNQKAVDSHWERAEELVEKSGIDPDNYKNADAKVRSAMDAIAPKRGDLIVNDIITKMGKGSEKVLFYLGRNESDLAVAQKKLIDDPLGLSLAFHLGGLNKKLSKPRKQTTNAPSPAPNLNGGGGGDTGTADEKAFKKKYDELSKKGYSQEVYNIKKEAKAAGVDVSRW